MNITLWTWPLSDAPWFKNSICRYIQSRTLGIQMWTSMVMLTSTPHSSSSWCIPPTVFPAPWTKPHPLLYSDLKSCCHSWFLSSYQILVTYNNYQVLKNCTFDSFPYTVFASSPLSSLLDNSCSLLSYCDSSNLGPPNFSPYDKIIF